jgi:hypothetical protein
MKYFLRSILAVFSLGALVQAQPHRDYWQQSADYTMRVSMDHKTHRYTGNQVIHYSNHSPDTLKQVFYHLQFNAFQPGSNMDERSRDIFDPDRRVGGRIANLKENEIGYLKVYNLKQEGSEAKTEHFGTVLKVALPQPIPPGKSTVLELDFEGQVPVQIRRSGRNNSEGIDYSMAQWYPKLANYDRYGWNTTPYVGREFYGIWGNFDVYIDIHHSYTVAATGILQNPEEMLHGYAGKGKAKGVWHFKAERVHDFVWAADPDYIHTTQQVEGGPLMRFFHKEKKGQAAENWAALPDYMARFFTLADSLVGPYPYPEFSFIQGGDGGMEYPMATLMMGRGDLRGMVGLAVHEAMHNWFYGMIASNESRYPWMDEGFTTFVENIIMQELFPREGIMATNPHANNYAAYKSQYDAGKTEPLSTPSDHYLTNRGYGIASYSQGCLLLNNLKYIMGDEAFWKGFRSFFNKWAFHHPHPEDFTREMERASGMQLQWFVDLWLGTTQAIDLSIDSVYGDSQHTYIVIGRKGDIPIPANVAIATHSGAIEMHFVPIDLMYGRTQGAGTQHSFWKWASRKYVLKINRPFDEVSVVMVDAYFETADIERANNRWKR